MPQYATFSIDNASICLWKLTESPEQLLALLPTHLNYPLQIARFRSVQRQREWLASRVLLHQTLGNDVVIDYDTHGAPYLAPLSGETSPSSASFPSISISHSGEWVAIAMDFSGQPLGFDLEKISEKAARVQHKFLTDEEAKLLSLPFPSVGLPHLPANSAVSPTALWCAKEAAYKLAHTPGLLFLEQMILHQKDEQLLLELPTLQRTARILLGEIETCAFALARFL